MYIPEFWCGVGATIIVEVIVTIIIIVCSVRKEENEKDE